jgi:hypothetical protein
MVVMIEGVGGLQDAESRWNLELDKNDRTKTIIANGRCIVAVVVIFECYRDLGGRRRDAEGRKDYDC